MYHTSEIIQSFVKGVFLIKILKIFYVTLKKYLVSTEGFWNRMPYILESRMHILSSFFNMSEGSLAWCNSLIDKRFVSCMKNNGAFYN